MERGGSGPPSRASMPGRPDPDSTHPGDNVVPHLAPKYKRYGRRHVSVPAGFLRSSIATAAEASAEAVRRSVAAELLAYARQGIVNRGYSPSVPEGVPPGS